MNKKYIAPAVEVYNVNNTTLLEGSSIISEGLNDILGGEITDPTKIASKLSDIPGFEDVEE